MFHSDVASLESSIGSGVASLRIYVAFYQFRRRYSQTNIGVVETTAFQPIAPSITRRLICFS